MQGLLFIEFSVFVFMVPISTSTKCILQQRPRPPFIHSPFSAIHNLFLPTNPRLIPMTNPPSQAGRFKPRKPVRKVIRPGATTGAPPTQPVVPSSSSAPPRRNAGRGGRGRGGRSAPIPQGRAFFGANQEISTVAATGRTTAQVSTAVRGTLLTSAAAAASAIPNVDATSAASRRQASSSDRKPLLSSSQRTNSISTAKRASSIGSPPGAAAAVQEEEVVGMIEGIGVGGAAPEAVPSALLEGDATSNKEKKASAKKPKSKKAKVGNVDALATLEVKGETKPEDADEHQEDDDDDRPLAIFEYDSDSSGEADPMQVDDDDEGYVDFIRPSQKPLTLPFPEAQHAAGVGAPLASMPMDPHTTSASAWNNHGVLNLPSPFVGGDSTHGLQEKDQSWFLVQLPTRLPPLHGRNTHFYAGTTSGNNTTAEATNEIVPVEPSSAPVEKKVEAVPATPSLHADCFDHTSLLQASVGKIGKFVVYENGATEFVLTGSDGRPYRFDAAEGLSCSFRQEAVAINRAAHEFISLGKVGKTIVVTPKLDSAFRSSG